MNTFLVIYIVSVLIFAFSIAWSYRKKDMTNGALLYMATFGVVPIINTAMIVMIAVNFFYEKYFKKTSV